MKRVIEITVGFLLTSFALLGQSSTDVKIYYAGFKTLKLVDTSRMYKPNTTASDDLHYRPVDLDIWYPISAIEDNKKLTFGDLFGLFEQRANQYQDTVYTGIVEELAQFYAIELGLGIEGGKKLLRAETDSYAEPEPAKGKFPLVIYMAGLNGMGFENFKILERLAARGFIVVSVWSVGRYPGNMTSHKLDMMEQVYDAEFVLRYLRSQDELILSVDSIGVLACSWGGMSAATLADRNPVVSTIVSLDGTETHYFGESDEDDDHIREIHHSNLLNPEIGSVAYLHLESGSKLDAYSPTGEFHYYKKLNSPEKYYLRFLRSRHEDFTSIPSSLQASQNAVQIHNQIAETALLFFEKQLLKMNGFKSYYSKLSLSENISTIPFDKDYKNTDYSSVQGKIQDFKTGAALAFVNIGISKHEIGTVTNEDGRFELRIKPKMENDTIKISMIGYKTRMLTVKELLKQRENEIKLKEETKQLQEVVVTTQGLKKKNLGNKTTSKFISTGFGYDKLGAEMGIKVNVRKRPTFVDAFNFHISYNRLSAKALFRLNVYEVEKGRPSRNIMTENIIIPINPKQTGLISVDLIPHNIVLKDDVIVTLEWVKNEGENKKGEGIFFSLGVLNSGTFIKRSSQGSFKKFSNMGVGMNFDVRY